MVFGYLGRQGKKDCMPPTKSFHPIATEEGDIRKEIKAKKCKKEKKKRKKEDGQNKCSDRIKVKRLARPDSNRKPPPPESGTLPLRHGRISLNIWKTKDRWSNLIGHVLVGESFRAFWCSYTLEKLLMRGSFAGLLLWGRLTPLSRRSTVPRAYVRLCTCPIKIGVK